MSSEIQIWKLQKPLFTTGGYNDILAYTEGKKKTAVVPVADEDIDFLFGDEPKVYVRARIKRGNLQILEIIEEQDW